MKRNSSQNFKALSTLSSSSKRTNLKTFVDHDVKHVYSIVSDIDRYSEFVPWCTRSKIVKVVGPNEVLADLTVGFQGLSEETFRSRVFAEPNHSVTSIASSDLYSKSPLKSLENVWTFESTHPQKTLVQMDLTFEFHNPIYTKLTSYLLDRISSHAMHAFVKRCNELKTTNEIGDACDLSFPTTDLILSLASCSHFTVEEIELLTHEFSKLATGKHRLSKEDLRNWLVCSDEFAHELFRRLDKDSNNGLTLREFIGGISTISSGTSDEKWLFWFGQKREKEDIKRREVENMIIGTNIVRMALRKTIMTSYKNFTIFTNERPEITAIRLTAPIFRGKTINIRALEHLIVTL